MGKFGGAMIQACPGRAGEDGEKDPENVSVGPCFVCEMLFPAKLLGVF
jgi:hypothetical protein